ncbi:hypothetical protein A0H81_04436 [Grifola frondosa]|uniref:Uncharacterized protein n=1 Tax=Grifola frondosa TaxID=5627 RepID=A0A1C7MH96_GRIFR|nr:hypothetical protein A0H81_04436 [Grifola frondosa]
MRRSPSPIPVQEREEVISTSHHPPKWRSRSPPTAPRHHLRSPPSVSSPKITHHTSSLPPKPDWSRHSGAGYVSTPKAEPTTLSHATPEPHIQLPAIPLYKPKPNASAEFEAEIARLRAHRAHITSEYATIAKATRRALHELDMASIDLKMAERRRAIADAQVEKARAGALGVDYVH